MARLIVAMCIYNEDAFIDKTIDSLLAKVRDVDVIEILDGAWKHGGNSPVSTDKTVELINKCVTKYHNRCDIVYRPATKIFENEAEKRNTQLEIIEETYGYEPYNVFVLDADERVMSASGIFEFWFKDHIGNLPFIGCVKTFAHSSNKPMFVPRFFPGNLGIHYHNHRSMIVHTGDHSINIDYNLAVQQDTFGDWHKGIDINRQDIYQLKEFFIVNFYPKRDRDRMLSKMTYNKFQMEVEQQGNPDCDYQQKIRGSEEEIEA